MGRSDLATYTLQVLVLRLVGGKRFKHGEAGMTGALSHY